MDLLQVVQDGIENIYNVSVQVKATDFLIGRNEVLQLVPPESSQDIPDELFLVSPHPDGESCEVALFLDERLCHNLANNSPFESLNKSNVNDFCVAIEGVSHFVYYLYKSSQKQNISQLELELQAEIDKFVLLSFFLKSDGPQSVELMDLLFEGYDFLEHLNPKEFERYATASSLARKYCYRLNQMIQSTSMTDVLEEVRRFYPLPKDMKIHQILQ